MLHGSLSYVLQDADGQTAPVHSISAGLDYPGVGPEHSYWKDVGRVRYTTASDEEALEATDDAEATDRLRKLLEAYSGKRIATDAEIRSWRAIGLLGQIGSKKAIALLKSLAAGHPDAELTRRAKAMLGTMINEH